VRAHGGRDCVHSKSILHADLNGNNVLMHRPSKTSDTVTAKVSDFGLSRVHADKRPVATMTHGTVTHMPPELLLENRLSKAADVYAFGVLLWELHTGSRPWGGLRHAQITAQKMRGEPQDMLQWPAASDEAIKAIAQQCLQSGPHERPTFDGLLEMLKPLQVQL